MALADRILQALKDHENEKPRNKQLTLGPSELGGCREYIRNVMVGTPRQDSDEWPSAAVMGTLVGSHVEAVMEERMGAVTEVPVKTILPSGLTVAGHADIVIPEENLVADCKSKDKLDGVRYEGPSLENCIQISVYALGLVQAGILTQDCTAHLIYVDRSGEEQVIYERELSWAQMEQFIELAEQRLAEVVEAQEHIDRGEVEYARDLRDKTPPFCYSKKVQCPFRDACWLGSEWVPHETIEDPDVVDAVAKFVAARDDEKDASNRRREFRSRLQGVKGITPNGYSVNWTGDEDNPRLYVTKVRP